jgi:hypothetical protein
MGGRSLIHKAQKMDIELQPLFFKIYSDSEEPKRENGK